MTQLPPGFTYLGEYKPQREATLIDGLLSTDLTVVSAQTKVGKSWLAGFVAKSVATGTDFLGQSVVGTPGRVGLLQVQLTVVVTDHAAVWVA